MLFMNVFAASPASGAGGRSTSGRGTTAARPTSGRTAAAKRPTAGKSTATRGTTVKRKG